MAPGGAPDTSEAEAASDEDDELLVCVPAEEPEPVPDILLPEPPPWLLPPRWLLPEPVVSMVEFMLSAVAGRAFMVSGVAPTGDAAGVVVEVLSEVDDDELELLHDAENALLQIRVRRWKVISCCSVFLAFVPINTMPQTRWKQK